MTPRFWRGGDSTSVLARAVPLVWCGACLLHYLRYFDPQLPLLTDIRYYVYFALETANGAVPYVSFFDLKTPLATLAGAVFAGAASWLGLDALVGIRVGYLLIAGATAALAGLVHARLFANQVAGVVASLMMCALPLVGALAAIGNVPKLLMHLLGLTAAWAVLRGAWIAAGAAAALAFMDWQVGGLVVAGVLIAAAADVERRWHQLSRVSIGIALTCLALAAYFAAHGALLVAWRQTVAEMLSYGSPEGTVSMADRLSRLAAAYRFGGPDRGWLVVLAGAGMVAAPWAAWRARGHPTARAWIVLLCLHGGLVTFSVVDFQWLGDLMALLISLVFFAAVSTSVLLDALRRRTTGVDWTRRAPVVMTLAIAALPALRPARVLRPLSGEDPALTLDDQRALGASLLRQAGPDVVLLNHTELAVVAPLRATLPFVYWDAPAAAHFAGAFSMPTNEALGPVLEAAGWPTIVTDGTSPLTASWTRHYCVHRVSTPNGRYAVRVLFSPPQRCGSMSPKAAPGG